jgi:hypothetical protein
MEETKEIIVETNKPEEIKITIKIDDISLVLSENQAKELMNKMAKILKIALDYW